ncbi:MAG: coenzyme F430 synthase [Methanimicrococcus sp.]|nr:coenzyme F430 synthase [Methanimicrococcus sp.]
MPNSEIPWKKVAVFDLNHGGLTIAKHLASRGVSVTAFDTYGKMDLAQLEKKFDLKMSNDPDFVGAEDFEIICLPIHLSPLNPFYKKAKQLEIPIISHHEIVGRLLRADRRLNDITLIEITGICGKTSTAVLLAQMLSADRKIAAHTSKGLMYWEENEVKHTEQSVSITPAHILDIIDIAFDKFKPDTFIFEISLGFTGAQDIAILTEIDPEYTIAGNTITSTTAKTKMISGSKENSIFVVNDHDLEKVKKYIRSNQKIVVYDDTGDAAKDEVPTDVYLNISKLKDGQQTVDVESSGNDVCFRAKVSPGYDIFSYRTALSASIAAALEIGVTEQQITQAIESFSGIEGRMHEYEEGTRLVMDNSGSGLTIQTAQTALDYMIHKYLDKKSDYYDSNVKRDIYFVIGEEEKTVCEGLEPTGVAALVKAYEKDLCKVIFVGERLKKFAGEKELQKSLQKSSQKKLQNELQKESDDDIIENVVFADTFKDGLKKALHDSKNDDIVITAVKCFR